MKHEHKEAYIYGFKDGLTFGIEKGMELAEAWSSCEDCPPNTAPLMVESTATELPPTE